MLFIFLLIYKLCFNIENFNFNIEKCSILI